MALSRSLAILVVNNLPFLNGLLMANFTLGWLLVESHLPPDSPVKTTFHGLLPIVFFTGWITTTIIFTGCHCIHLSYMHRGIGRHWAGISPQGVFILRVVTSALLIFIAIAWHHGPYMTLHLALTFGLPVVSGSLWINTLWGDKERPVQPEVGVGD